MPRIKYVGAKEDGEAAFADQTRIARWLPGDSHDIPDPALCARLLQHPDVFALDKGKGSSPAPVQPPAPAVPPAPAPTVAGDLGEKVSATKPTEGAGTGLSLSPGAKVEPAAAAVTQLGTVDTSGTPPSTVKKTADKPVATKAAAKSTKPAAKGAAKK
jgi:hypothetical protein